MSLVSSPGVESDLPDSGEVQAQSVHIIAVITVIAAKYISFLVSFLIIHSLFNMILS